MVLSKGTTRWRTKSLVSAKIFEKSELSTSLLPHPGGDSGRPRRSVVRRYPVILPKLAALGGPRPQGCEAAGDPTAYPDQTMVNLSEKALAAQQALREASAAYQAVVDRVIENPRGQFVEKLREAEERVGETAARWALEYAEGAGSP
jgi:hypothetical protein